MRLIIPLFFIFCLQSNSQDIDSETYWKLMPGEHIHSYGKECDVLVFTDHKVVRDIFLFEPSIASLINELEIQGDKIILQIVIEEKGDTFILNGVEVRIHNMRGKIDNKESILQIRENLTSLKIECLIRSSDQEKYSFGAIFIK